MTMLHILFLAAAQNLIVLQEPVPAERIINSTFVKCGFAEFFILSPTLSSPATLDYGVVRDGEKYERLHSQALPSRPILTRVSGSCDNERKLAVIDVWYAAIRGPSWRYETVRVRISPIKFVATGTVNEIDPDTFWRLFR